MIKNLLLCLLLAPYIIYGQNNETIVQKSKIPFLDGKGKIDEKLGVQTVLSSCEDYVIMGMRNYGYAF